MEKSNKKPSKSAGYEEVTDDTGIEGNNKKTTGRRLQDAIISKNPNRKMKLDRRVKPDDRRDNKDPHYKGPARRVSIDTRAAKDRRDKG